MHVLQRRIAPLVVLLLFWVPSAGAWTWPVGGPVVQSFSFDPAHPYAAGQHRGVDVTSPAGTTVVAPASGVVSFAGSVPLSGISLTIETADGLSVTLTHLGSLGVARSAAVAEGAAIGTVGLSGTPEVEGPYVHLGIRTTVDPQGYLDPLGFLPALPLSLPAPVPVPAPAPGEPPAIQVAVAPPAAGVPPAPVNAPAAPPLPPAAVGLPAVVLPAVAPAPAPAPVAPTAVDPPAEVAPPSAAPAPQPAAFAQPSEPEPAPVPAAAPAGALLPEAPPVHPDTSAAASPVPSGELEAPAFAAFPAAPGVLSRVAGPIPAAATQVVPAYAVAERPASRSRSPLRSVIPAEARAVRAHAPSSAPPAFADAGGHVVARRPAAASRASRSSYGYVLALLALGALVASGLAAARIIRGPSPNSEEARLAAVVAEDPRRARLAVRQWAAPHRPRGRLRCAGGRLRALPPAQGQRRADGQRNGRARHAGDGVRRPERRITA